MGLRDLFHRKPRITDDNYGRLMMSFGRVVDRDPMVRGPAAALASRVVREEPEAVATVDGENYPGAAEYHLRMLAGSWIMAREGDVPVATAEVFVEAVKWKFPGSAGHLADRLTELTRGQFERDLRRDDEISPPS